MIKCIFFDIDGTLLSFRTHTIPESTKRALRALKEQGIKLFIASGRSPKFLSDENEVTSQGFDGYVMLNGQYCLVDGRVIHDVCLDREAVEQAVIYMKEQGISCEFLELDYGYANLINDKLLDLRKLVGATAPLPPVDESGRHREHKTYQLCPYISGEEEKEFFAHVPDCRGVRWNPLFVDVIPKDGGKPVGMEKLLAHFGLKREECMAFGDGGNDIAMLQFAGIGVAMGNASDEVKAAADMVTSSVDEDGILLALQAHGLLPEGA